MPKNRDPQGQEGGTIATQKKGGGRGMLNLGIAEYRLVPVLRLDL